MRDIITGARDIPAHRMARDLDRLAELRARAMGRLAGLDALLLPTAPRHPRVAEVAADPIGVYTNFVNLLELCAVAVPAGEVDGGPFGVTLTGGVAIEGELWSLPPAALGPPTFGDDRHPRLCPQRS
ncbi:hypothetical protein [Nonomuraea basaltis]|uniref:hypothetical protein n=1 Tax=Nonomuraea basaltis TaxID=2495887 RepID=UPI00197D7E0E|nr:hypothetical protein [Nonomuraea basaltis]